MPARLFHSETLIEIFNSDEDALAAVQELKRNGFSDAQITVTSHGVAPADLPLEEDIGEYAMSGAAAGLGLSAVLGLGILAGVAPDVTSAVVAGFPGLIFSTAAAGAALAGTSGAVVGTVHGHHFSHGELPKSPYTVVTVRSGRRASVASRVLNQFSQNKQSSQAM